MYQFYHADFRVRIHLANAFLRRLASLQGRQDEHPEIQKLFSSVLCVMKLALALSGILANRRR